MTRLYVVLAVLAVLGAGAGYLRYDAIQDERRAAELREAEQEIKDRKRIDEAITDSRSGGADWRARLCAIAPDQCGVQ